jgi:hypothetical protein
MCAVPQPRAGAYVSSEQPAEMAQVVVHTNNGDLV